MKPAAYDELSAANGEHLAILRIAQTCLEGKNPALLASHPFARLLPRRPPPATVADQDPLPPRLSGYFDAYLHLSADIANARAQLADAAVTGYLVMQLFQWTIVATGMFTTILISVKGFANPQSSRIPAHGDHGDRAVRSWDISGDIELLLHAADRLRAEPAITRQSPSPSHKLDSCRCAPKSSVH